jgi:hypothetical protein
MTCLCVFCKAEYSIAARRLQMHSCDPSGTASRQEHARRPYRCSQRACRCDSAPGRCESERASWAFSGHLHRICTCPPPSVGVACMIRRGRTSLVRNNETADAPVSAAASATTPGLPTYRPAAPLRAICSLAAYFAQLVQSTAAPERQSIRCRSLHLKVSCWPFVWLTIPPSRLEPQASAFPACPPASLLIPTSHPPTRRTALRRRTLSETLPAPSLFFGADPDPTV